MASLTASSMLLPSRLTPSSLSDGNNGALLLYRGKPSKKKSVFPVMRLFGPAIFEASKLKVLFLGVDDKKQLPRAYTLTHSDITARLTLAISQTINNSQLQGWANRIYRDEVVAEWKKVKGKMSLHVHCHISGGHFLLDLCARLRYYIFSKELPVVLKAFAHGDEDLFRAYPELEESLVWVYFHSNTPQFNRVECWGPLKDAVAPSHKDEQQLSKKNTATVASKVPKPCKEACSCCFPPFSVIPWAQDQHGKQEEEARHQGGLPEQNF